MLLLNILTCRLNHALHISRGNHCTNLTSFCSVVHDLCTKKSHRSGKIFVNNSKGKQIIIRQWDKRNTLSKEKRNIHVLLPA